MPQTENFSFPPFPCARHSDFPIAWEKKSDDAAALHHFKRATEARKTGRKREGEEKTFHFREKNNCPTRSLRPLSVRSLCIFASALPFQDGLPRERKVILRKCNAVFFTPRQRTESSSITFKTNPQKEPITQHCQHTKVNKVVFRDACFLLSKRKSSQKKSSTIHDEKMYKKSCEARAYVST